MMFQKEILDVLDEAEKNILSHPKGELILAGPMSRFRTN